MEGLTITEERVICDSCGKETPVELWTREIAKDRDGCPVTEQYFDCKECGKHYTVIVCDRKMRMDIQKRRSIQAQIRLHMEIHSKRSTVELYKQKEENLKAKMIRRSQELKEKYREECQNVYDDRGSDGAGDGGSDGNLSDGGDSIHGE